jgi:hypothetical protein
LLATKEKYRYENPYDHVVDRHVTCGNRTDGCPDYAGSGRELFFHHRPGEGKEASSPQKDQLDAGCRN